jgi:hypothetical protein
VGGNYKFDDSAKDILQNFGFLDDSRISTNETNKKDLRGYIKRKFVYDFINWFFTQKNRETSNWREFYEELIETNIFPKNIFPFINTKYIGCNTIKINPKNYNGEPELKIQEILDFLCGIWTD